MDPAAPPTTVNFNNSSGAFKEALFKWSDSISVTMAWSPTKGTSKLCNRDANGNWGLCKEAQAWGLTINKASWFSNKLGKKFFNFPGLRADTINEATAAPSLFSYALTYYDCMFDWSGVSCASDAPNLAVGDTSHALIGFPNINIPAPGIGQP